MAAGQDSSADACPVDHETRAAWLKMNPNAAMPHGANPTAKAASTIEPPQPKKQGGMFSWLWASPASASSAPAAIPRSPPALGLDREISTIPRASAVGEGEGAQPANNEKEGGVSEGGNWIYPSEKMFFDAMKRKGHSPEETDMRTIVPIHNAVNERAWKEIKEWEKPWGSDEKCGGPKLYSFSGLSKELTPRARFNTLLGYTAPFDRHDWVIDRCGTQIEYVIDFYAGKNDGSGKLNFFLDVRPKLNSWEGVKMRAARTFGLA